MSANSKAPETFPSQLWEGAIGVSEYVPGCPSCDRPMVWRGAWQCAGCSSRGGWEALRAYACPLELPSEALAGAPIFSSPEGNNSTATWRQAVEALTSFHRRKVAARLRTKGTRRREHVDESWDEETGEVTRLGPVTNGEPYINRWHEQRIVGQAERFQRVAECGAYEHAIDVQAPDGTKKTVPIEKRCDCWRVCWRCLNRRKWKLSNGMLQQRAKVLRVHKKETGDYYSGGEGKWTEKLITFTVPHGEAGPGADSRVLVGAWQRLLRRIRSHIRERRRGPHRKHDKRVRLNPGGLERADVHVPWYRALEVAPSDTGGHAHLHVWWFGPFLDVALLQLWWGELLHEAGVDGVQMVPAKQLLAVGRDSRMRGWMREAGRDLAAMVPRGIVDIITDKQGGTSAYAAKVGIALYTTKGTETLSLEPAHAAKIYEAFEGTRAVQWARGWAPPKNAPKYACVTFRRLTEEEKKELSRKFVSSMEARECGGKTSGKSAGGVESVTGGNQGPSITPAPDIPGPDKSYVTARNEIGSHQRQLRMWE